MTFIFFIRARIFTPMKCWARTIRNRTASAACGAWNPAGISHFGWCGVSSQHDGSSPSGAAISPAAERCQARLRYASLTAGNDSESDGKSSTPVMSVADFAPPPPGRDISIVFVFVSCSFTVKTCSTRRARGWLKVEGRKLKVERIGKQWCGIATQTENYGIITLYVKDTDCRRRAEDTSSAPEPAQGERL